MMRRAVLFGLLTALLLCFIWGQSMLPHDTSAGESTRLMHLLKPVLDRNGLIEEEAFHHYLRKSAHFAEFAALGFCLCGFIYSLPWKRTRLRIPSAALLCILAAAFDECIQLFSTGRGAQLRDVLLDSVGALVGIAVFLLLHRMKTT